MSQALINNLRNSGKLPEAGSIETNPYALTNEYHFIDADTIKSKSDPNWSGRLAGINAPEVSKFFGPDNIEGGTPGGRRAGAAIMNLARKEGFTNVIRTGEYDKYDREIVKLKNKYGQDFEENLVRSGVLDTTIWSSAQAVESARLAKAFGTADLGENYDIARNAIADAIADETEHGLITKDLALHEAQLAYGGDFYMPGSVAIRDPSRTLKNKAKSPLSEAWNIGWVGALEGLYGFLEMGGESLGSDMFKNIGEAGVYRNQRYLERKPEIVTSYKDVDGIFGKNGAFQYLLNNAAISVPYMATTMLGYAAAGPTAGLSLLAPVSLYTGTIWNDQSENNKNAGAAIAGGLTQAVLDRLGLQFLIGKVGTTLVTKEGRDEIIKAIMTNKGVSQTEARRQLTNLTRKEMAKLAKDGVMLAKKQIKARQVTKTLLKRASIGGLGEGATEGLQEAVGYIAAHVDSGFREWDAEEFNTRIIDGMLAGTGMGGAFGTAGTIYDYGVWRDVAYKLSPSTGKQISESGSAAKDDIAKHDVQFNIQENNRKLKAYLDGINEKLSSLDNQIRTALKKVKNSKSLEAKKKALKDLQLKQKKYNELKAGVEFEDINDRTERHEEALKNRTVTEMREDFWNNLPAIYRAMVKHIFPWELQKAADSTAGLTPAQVKARKLKGDIPALRHLAEAHSGNHEKSMTGMHYENRLHHWMAFLASKLDDVNANLFAFDRTDSRNSRLKFSEEFYEAFNKAQEKAKAAKREINWDTDLEGPLQGKADQFKALMKKLDDLGDIIYKEQRKHNPYIGRLKHFLARSRSLDKEKIARDRGRFEALLVKHYKYTPEKAKELTTAILNIDGTEGVIDNGMLNYDGNFSVTSKVKFRPKAQKSRELGISDNSEFNDFLENDLFTNVSNNLKSAVRYIALEEYVGADNQKINYWLDKAEKQLIESGKSPKEARKIVDQIAFRMKRYYDAQSGNYKRTHKPVWEMVKKNIIFVTGITSLPFATVSNTVELGTSLRGLSHEQIFGKPAHYEMKNGKLTMTEEGKKGSINGLTYSFAEEFANTANRFFGTLLMKPTKQWRESYGYRRLKELGHLTIDTGAAHTTGVSEVGHWRQRFLDMYFKVIGLQQWTNAMRAGRAAIAADYILDKAATVAEYDSAKLKGDDPVWTNEMEEAQEALRNLGIDPQFMLDFHKMDESDPGYKTAEAKYKSFMREGEFNFVNEAVVLPQTANRPLIFQDPRFALFTQFQGFISTFTAWHLPKAYKELVKRGTPGMNYSAYAAAMSMIALGFASQHLKDLLKYGEPTPYFTGMEYMRRGVGASGLLGTGERLIDFAFPMYDKRYDNNLMWAFGTVAGESAALSKALRFGSLSWGALSGEKPPETMYKISPFSQMTYRHFHPDNVAWDFGQYPTGVGGTDGRVY